MSDKKTENQTVETKPVETKPEEPSGEEKPMFQVAKGKGVVAIVLVSIWVLAGISAFIYSLYCFTKSGTTAEKILGLILAMIAGPFYFIYVAMYKAYCR